MKAYLASLHAIWLDLTNKRLQYFVELVENSNPTTLIEFSKFLIFNVVFFLKILAKVKIIQFVPNLKRYYDILIQDFGIFKY
jgi:hypothetical protein